MKCASRLVPLAGLAILVACKRGPESVEKAAAPLIGATLLDVGPRILSNETHYPISLYGHGFTEGLTLVLSGERRIELETAFVSETELGAVLPAGQLVTRDSTREAFDLQLQLRRADKTMLEGQAVLTVVNDQSFFTPLALELGADEGQVFVTSRTTDELLLVDRKNGGLERIPVGDGPVGLARWRKGKAVHLVVSHESGAELLVLRADAPSERYSIPVPARSRGVTVIGDVAYVANQLEDSVLEIDLVGREIRRRIPVGVNPGATAAVGAGKLAVGNHGSDDTSIVKLEDGVEHRIVPGPGAPIVGGHTEPYAKYVMGGKVARALAGDAERGLVFAATLGPNIGPNPDRMEVTMNGGISVIDAKSSRFVRHVSLLRGVPEALALDEARGLLYVADQATGRVVVMSTAALANTDESAKKAILGFLEITPPADARLVRPAEDFAIKGRAGTSIHTGPADLRLVDGGRTLLVLCRFSRELVELDVSAASKGLLAEKMRHALHSGPDQETRRLGEILYFTDLGNSRMTCDTCHPSGHAGGLLFTKGRPMRIYRSPSLRGARESPPFFTPTKLESLYDMSRQVLARNRYENPVPTTFEKKALTLYVTLLPTPPNPYRTKSGVRPETLRLPDQVAGRPEAGRALFYGKGGCAEKRCHPPPHFTADQDPKTRGLLHHVGTPLALGLRPEMQDMQPDYGWPAAALLGVWDSFPLLASGAGGSSVNATGQIEASDPFALRRVLEGPMARTHGGMAALSEVERNDLLAFLLTL